MVRVTWASYRNAIGVVVFCCNECYLKHRKKGFPPKLKWYQDLYITHPTRKKYAMVGSWQRSWYHLSFGGKPFFLCFK
jgi:hypothetical protein